MEEVPKGGSASTSNYSSLRKFWKYLWSMNIPYKVRHFAWRACKDILPTTENLKRRKVLVDSCCEAWQTETESSGHLFWLCSRAKEVWRVSKLFSGQLNLHFSSFMDLIWFMIMVEKWDAANVEKIIMIAWALWSNRNREEVKSCGALVDFLLDYLREYQLCC